MSDTPITDKATYWHTAEGGDVVNPADMEALERQMNALTAELARVTAERDALRAAFEVNMIRAFPEKSHDEIRVAIDAARDG